MTLKIFLETEYLFCGQNKTITITVQNKLMTNDLNLPILNIPSILLLPIFTKGDVSDVCHDFWSPSSRHPSSF